jgi:hypothetical protein
MRYRMLGLGVAVAATLLAGGCGGDQAGDKKAPAAGGDYAGCLRDHGITLPSGNGRGSFSPGAGRPSGQPRPSGSPGDRRGGGFVGNGQAPAGVDPSAWAKAQRECGALRPSVNPSRGPGGGFGGDNSAFTAYRNCLSDHGVTMQGFGQDLDQNDPKVAEALKVCAPLRPSDRPGGRGDATPSPTG